ncbi:hypothetical protein ACFPOU_14700, partial [Massilia jejuensis]
TYRLLIVKELVWYCLAVFCESFCSSAAEKRDYAVFRVCRQLLLFRAPRFPQLPAVDATLCFVVVFSRRRIIAKLIRCRK